MTSCMGSAGNASYPCTDPKPRITHVDTSIVCTCSAAIGMARRGRLCKVRHLAVSDLWSQAKITCKKLELANVKRFKNPAGMRQTKYLDGGLLAMLKDNLQRVQEESRATRFAAISPETTNALLYALRCTCSANNRSRGGMSNRKACVKTMGKDKNTTGYSG